MHAKVPPFAIGGFLHEPLRTLLHPVEPAVRKLLSLERLQLLYGEARGQPEDGGTVERLLQLLGITPTVDEAELRHIPRSGPAVVVANHPFGLLDGAILASLLRRVRPDVRILANSLLAGIPEMRDCCIFVDPSGDPGAVPGNAGALKRCLQWLRDGGLLAAFPAGEVAHLNWKERAVADPEWSPAVARIAQICGAGVTPLFFRGANSLAFQMAGIVHPALRTASLPRELLNKRGSHIQVRAGRPVAVSVLRSFRDSAAATQYLRCRTHLLGEPVAPARPYARPRCTVAPAQDSVRLAREIAGLPPGRRLCESNHLAVYVGAAHEMPTVVGEIGRLREIAFRAVGEGSGKESDLDNFDRYYLHLVLWNQTTSEVVGAYRLGPAPDILPRFGVKGLYTSTLFRYGKGLFDTLGPAIELGRSFIRPEYQRQYAPLLMLWKGIGRYVAGRPECGVLFGGVSISSAYHPLSRHLMVRFLEAHRVPDLAGRVAARKPYRPAPIAHRLGKLETVPDDLDWLSDIVSDLEADGKGVPVLVRQYLKTGGRVLGFNVDPKFSNALDALILVDLRRAAPSILNRYLGQTGARIFRAWHQSAQSRGDGRNSSPALHTIETPAPLPCNREQPRS